MNFQKNVSLKNYTTFRTGGTADFLCTVESKKSLIECFRWIKQEKYSFFCLGNGSNLLVNDAGFHGVAIKIANIEMSWKENSSSIGAGVLLPKIISVAKDRGLGGMEWASGIPATLGGAVRNNAGAFGSDIGKMVASVEIFNTQSAEFKTIKQADCGFSYHQSILHKNPTWIIWKVDLTWEKKEPKKIEELIQAYLDQRKERQPLESPSAGSFFRNPEISKLAKEKREKLIADFVQKELSRCGPGQDPASRESELRKKVQETGVLPAAHFIEEAGLKGRKIGGAQVSEKHANFIINTGSAKTEDVVILASMIKQKVRTKFGVQLHEEVEYVGF